MSITPEEVSPAKQTLNAKHGAANGLIPNAVFSMPGYTGHVKGMYDTIGVTPGHAQYKALLRGFSEMDPTGAAPIARPRRDPCNDPDATFKKTTRTDDLWPSSCKSDAGKMAVKPYSNRSHLVMGDERFFQKQSHYCDVHANATTATGAMGIMDTTIFNTPGTDATPHGVRKAARLGDLTRDELKAKYDLVKARIDDKTLKRLEDNMKLRLQAKQTNDNVNGKRMMRMFLQFDEDSSGFIDFEEFHKGLLSYGIQFEPEQSLRLFAKYDPNADGYLSYTEFMEEMIESQYFALAFNNSRVKQQNRTEMIKDYAKTRAHKQLLALRTALLSYLPCTEQSVNELFDTIDVNEDSVISTHEFDNIISRVGFNLLPKEKELLFNMLDTETGHSAKTGHLSHAEFMSWLFPQIER